MLKFIVFTLLVAFSGLLNAANTVLCDELTNDPLGRGYAAKTTEQKTSDINTKYRVKWKKCVDGVILRDQIEEVDWVAIGTDAQRDRLISVLDGCVNPQGFARFRVVEILGAGSQSLSNMAAVAQNSISRAAELGLGKVRASDVLKCGG